MAWVDARHKCFSNQFHFVFYRFLIVNKFIAWQNSNIVVAIAFQHTFWYPLFFYRYLTLYRFLCMNGAYIISIYVCVVTCILEIER